MFWECGKACRRLWDNKWLMCLRLQVDCTANTNTCNKYGVSGYPTLKIFRDGEESGAYDGPRTAGKGPELRPGNCNCLAPLFFVVET